MGHQTNIIQMAWIVLCIIIVSILDSTLLSSSLSPSLPLSSCTYSYSFFHFMIRAWLFSVWTFLSLISINHMNKRFYFSFYLSSFYRSRQRLLEHPLLSEWVAQYQVCSSRDGFLVREYTWTRTCFKFAKWVCVHVSTTKNKTTTPAALQ